MSTESLMHKNGTTLWSREEVELLYDEDLTDEDIARLTGRTVVAVKHKRLRDLGEYPEDAKMRALRGEIRIIKLAKQMNIKLAPN